MAAVVTTQVRTLIASTGASGAAGFTALVAAHNTAVATGVTAAQAVTGAVVNSITFGNTQIIQDANASTFEIFTAINYITQV